MSGSVANLRCRASMSNGQSVLPLRYLPWRLSISPVVPFISTIF